MKEGTSGEKAEVKAMDLGKRLLQSSIEIQIAVDKLQVLVEPAEEPSRLEMIADLLMAIGENQERQERKLDALLRFLMTESNDTL
ncbi:MAG: hypothetical protein WCH43_14860 [Verrucomicrobiota bacterium]